MEENIKTPKKIRPYLKWVLIVFTATVVLSIGFLTLKGPTLVKGISKAFLEQSFAPLGIEHVEIDTVRFGWGRIYLENIHTTAPSFAPSLRVQEMDIALSVFFRIKAIDMVGATLELKDGVSPSFSKDEWRGKIDHFGKVIDHIKQLKLPTIAMHDCLLIIPAAQGPLKIPVHAVTETTVTRNQVLTVDWGEYGENKFYGQFILELGQKGGKIDVHTANIDIKMPSFQIKAPEISFWGTTANEEEEGYKVDGFAKFDHLMLASYGTLKMPLEVNFEGSGTQDNLVLDELTISPQKSKTNLLELEGRFKPDQSFAQMVLTSQIPQLSKLWDFTPLLATHANDKVSVEGYLNLAGKVLWEEGRFKSALALNIKGVTVAREGFSIEGVASQLTFSALKPLTTKGPQRLSATKLSFGGIDLKNILFECLFDNKGLLQINQFTAEALRGKLKAHRFQRLANTSHPSYQFEADFENIELADILKLTDLRSLSGRAKLAGNASMRYGLEEGLDVLQAELHSISDFGLIQYKPESGGGEMASLDQKEVNMAFQVLDNLNFTLFNVRLEHSPNHPSEMQGIVKMLGSNPKVLNGYPFEFNIVTTGKLKDLVINTIQHMKPYTDLKELNKAIQVTKEAKAAKSAKVAKETKIPKTAKPMKATKTIKVARKVKLAKGTKRFKQKNRKLKDG